MAKKKDNSWDDFNNLVGWGDAKTTYKAVGFDKEETRQFMQTANSLASAKQRQDVNALEPKFKKKEISESTFNRYEADESQNPYWGGTSSGGVAKKAKDQIQGFMSAFRKRQDEVFGRRAQPGVQQTRLT